MSQGAFEHVEEGREADGGGGKRTTATAAGIEVMSRKADGH